MKNKRLIIFISLVLFLYPVTAFSGWTPMTSGTTAYLYGVWGSSGSDVFAVGHNYNTYTSIVPHYNGSAWSTTFSVADYILDDVWGSSYNDVFAVGWDTGFSKIFHYNGSAWSIIYDNSGDLYGVWGSSGSDVFAVGDRVEYDFINHKYLYYSLCIHYNGSTWSGMNTNITTNILHGVWGSSGTDVFAVGGGGTIIHYDGNAWSSMTSGTTNYLGGVWGSSGSDVFAVGNSGTIIHYNGSSWSAMSSGTTNNLRGVWGTSGSDVFAVGGSGTILHYDGNAWSSMTSGTTNYLLRVWGSSGTDVFAVGENGTILHYNGTPTVIALSSFTATPSNKEVIIQWSTESEIDNAGFNIYRSKSEHGEYIKINDLLIPAEGSSTQGASYEFIDKDVKNRKMYFYKLEDIDLNGTSTMHGPVSGTPRWIFGIFKK